MPRILCIKNVLCCYQRKLKNQEIYMLLRHTCSRTAGHRICLVSPTLLPRRHPRSPHRRSTSSTPPTLVTYSPSIRLPYLKKEWNLPSPPSTRFVTKTPAPQQGRNSTLASVTKPPSIRLRLLSKEDKLTSLPQLRLRHHASSLRRHLNLSVYVIQISLIISYLLYNTTNRRGWEFLLPRVTISFKFKCSIY